MWVPLARLSYCIYLVHMFVIAYFTSIFTFSVTFTHLLGVYWILGMLWFSVMVAYVMSIGFEVPITHLEKVGFALLGIGKLPPVKRPPTAADMSKH